MPTDSDSDPRPAHSPLLRLPLELRQQIYSYLLPSTPYETLRPGQKRRKGAPAGVIWRRGHTALLATSRQLHAECAALMYGRSTFALDVTYDSIRFRCRWGLPWGVVPNRTFDFFELFSAASVARMRHFVVNVEHVDSYTGMMKYNCGGIGLTEGLRRQVERLADALETVEAIRSLQVRLMVGNAVLNELRRVPVHRVEADGNPAVTQTVLNPLTRLAGVERVKITGAVTEHFAGVMERKMTRAPG